MNSGHNQATPAASALTLDVAALKTWPLPVPALDGDKEQRGRALVIAGSREIPGAAILACNAALRAGVGKLTLVTVASVADGIALAVPEARVIAMPDDLCAWRDASNMARLQEVWGRAHGVLVGPGMEEGEAMCDLTEALLGQGPQVPVVLDAAAMGVVLRRRAPFAQPVLLTPHAGEMARLTGEPKEALRGGAVDAALDAARQWGAVVVLKGACTVIAAPDGQLWRHEGGNVGLAVSGSGDTAAGLMTGLLARGATLPQAAAWGVVLHASAGQQLARRWGLLGYLAREIADEVPKLMDQWTPDLPGV